MSVLVEERPHDAPHPPQPRRLLRSAPLRSPFPSGARLSARILFVRMTVTVKAMIASVLLALIDKDNRNKPCPAGEGGPQRKKNANTWSDFLTRLRWMRCITRTLFHIFANAIGAELMTRLLFYMQKTKKKPRARRGERLKCRKTFFDACVTRVVLYRGKYVVVIIEIS